jgi:hypothetical protein
MRDRRFRSVFDKSKLILTQLIDKTIWSLCSGSGILPCH